MGNQIKNKHLLFLTDQEAGPLVARSLATTQKIAFCAMFCYPNHIR